MHVKDEFGESSGMLERLRITQFDNTARFKTTMTSNSPRHKKDEEQNE